MGFRHDYRAQASGFIVFFLILAVGALVYGLLDPVASGVFASSLNSSQDPQAISVINQRQRIWDNILFFIIAFAGIFIIARAVFQSRR